jgi:hypothetical protein
MKGVYILTYGEKNENITVTACCNAVPCPSNQRCQQET